MAVNQATLGTAVLRAMLDKTQYDSSMANMRRDTINTMNDVQRDLQASLNKISTMTATIGGMLTVGVTTPLAAIGTVGINSAMQLETFAASLNVLLGDAEAAAEVFEDLYQFSAETPFDWKQLSNATRVLAAFGSEAEDILPQLDMLGDVAAGVNTRIDELAEIFGRVQISGRVSMQEVNSLAQRGIPIYTELAKQFEVTEGEVRDLVSSGVVGFGHLNRMFIDLTSSGGKFFGMMEAQADVTQGKWNRLKDEFEVVTDTIGELLLPIINQLIDAGTAATLWFTNLDEEFQMMVITAGIVVAAIGPLLVAIGAITKAASVLIGVLAAGFGPLGIVIAVSAAITGLVWNFMRVTTATTNWEEAAYDLQTQIRQLNQAQDEQIRSSMDARDALDELKRASSGEGVLGAVNALTKALQGDAQAAMEDYAISTIAPMVQQGRLQEAIQATILKFIELRVEANRAKMEALQGLRDEVQRNLEEIQSQIESFTASGLIEDVEAHVAEVEARMIRGYGQLSGYALKVVEEDGRRMVRAVNRNTGEIVTSFGAASEATDFLVDTLIDLNIAIGAVESPMVRSLRNALVPFTEQASDLDTQIAGLIEQTSEYTTVMAGLEDGSITVAEAIEMLDEDLQAIFSRYDQGRDVIRDATDETGKLEDKVISLNSVLGDLRQGLQNVETLAKLVGEDFDEAAKTSELFEAAARALIDNGLIPAEMSVEALVEKLRELVEESEKVTNSFGHIGDALQKLGADIITERQPLDDVLEQAEALREGILGAIAAVTEGGINSDEELSSYLKLVGYLTQVDSLIDRITEKQKKPITPPTHSVPGVVTRQANTTAAEAIAADTLQANLDSGIRHVDLTGLGIEAVVRDTLSAAEAFRLFGASYRDFLEVVDETPVLGPPGGIPEYMENLALLGQHQVEAATRAQSVADGIIVDTLTALREGYEAALEAGDLDLVDKLVKDGEAYVERWKNTLSGEPLEALMALPEEMTGAKVSLSMPDMSSAIVQVQTAADVIFEDYVGALSRATIESQLFGEELDLNRVHLGLMRTAVTALLDEGYDQLSPEVQALANAYLALTQNMEENEQAVLDQAAADRALADARAQLNELTSYLVSQTSGAPDEFEQMRAAAEHLAQQLDLTAEQLEYLLDLIDELEEQSGETASTFYDDATKYINAAREIVGAFDAFSNGDIEGGLRAVFGVVADGVELITGIPGIGAAVESALNLIVDVLGDMANGIQEVREEVEKMQRGFSLINVDNLVQTERVSRGGLLGWLGFTKEAINEEITEWRLQIAQSLESGFTSGLSGAVNSILTGADDSLEQLKKGLESAVVAAIVDATINSAIIAGMLGPLLESLTLAIASGDFDTARDIVSSIQAELPAIAQALEELLAPFVGIFTPDPDEVKDMLDPLNPRNRLGLDFALPPTIQLAIATPLLESANAFGMHVESFGTSVDDFMEAVRMDARNRSYAPGSNSSGTAAWR